jgi:hypothetical protein
MGKPPVLTLWRVSAGHTWNDDFSMTFGTVRQSGSKLYCRYAAC